MMTRWLVALLVASVLAGCAASALTPVNRLADLQPGVSTRADVERVLGTRDGIGAAAFPPGTQPASASYEVWYYLNTQKKRVDRDVYGLVPRVLLVFFEKDAFKGYMWFDLVDAPMRRVR